VDVVMGAETVLMAAATLVSGSAVLGAKALLDIRDDAHEAMQILTGREDLNGDGLVHQVEDNTEQIDVNRRDILANSSRLERIEQEVGS
jgi:hypothetical protein